MAGTQAPDIRVRGLLRLRSLSPVLAPLAQKYPPWWCAAPATWNGGVLPRARRDGGVGARSGAGMTIHLRRAVFGAAVPCALMLASIGAPVAAAGDACRLLTTGEVGVALGAKNVTAKAAGDSCTYHGAGKPDVLTLEVHRNDGPGWTGITAGNAMIGAGKRAPKIGDQSVYGAMGQVLYVRKGANWFGIDMRGVMKDPGSVGPALARKAVARL